MVQPSKGFVWGYAVESALGTPGTYYEIRPNDFPAFPTSTRQLIANPNMGHAHAYNQSDKPIAIEQYQEGAGTFAQNIRRASANNAAAPIAAIFESAGCNVTTSTGDQTITYSSTTAWDVSDAAHGQCGLLELNSGVYYPVLVADYTTGTVTPSMAIPSVSSTGKAWQLMTTIWPRSRQVATDATLAFEHHSRATHTSGEDLHYIYTGCALSAVGDMTIEPFGTPALEFTFHVGDVDQANEAIAAESFVDGEKFAIINDDFRFEYANADSAGGITRGDGILTSAVITWGFETAVIPGEGSGTFNGAQGYMHRVAVPKVAITQTFTKDYWTQLEGDNTSKYIGLVQPTRSLSTPAFGFWMPNAHIDPETPPTVDWATNDFVTATVTYIADSAGYESATTNADAGAAPWYFAISGQYSA